MMTDQAKKVIHSYNVVAHVLHMQDINPSEHQNTKAVIQPVPFPRPYV